MTNPLIQTQSTYPMSAVRQRIDWNAIWGGVFMVAGIWAVFESLALAILAGTANAASGMGFGMAIWTIVLTIIAMYVAGRETSRLAGAVLAAGSIRIAGAHSSYVISAGAEWSAFITLLLGWLAAMGGGSTGVKQ